MNALITLDPDTFEIRSCKVVRDTAPDRKIPHSLFTYKALGTRGKVLAEGFMPPVSGLPTVREIWLPYDSTLAHLQIFKSLGWDTRCLSTQEVVLGKEPPIDPIPCFGSRRTSYEVGVRVGSLDGFATYNIVLPRDGKTCYIHISRGTVSAIGLGFPQKNTPSFTPTGKFYDR